MKFLTPAMLTIILLVVVGGLVVGYVAKTMLATEAPLPEERRNYPMAIAELKPGTVITEAHLAQGPWLASMTKPTYARTDSILLGRVVKNALKAATPIDTLDLYPPGEGLPLDIAVGMRAVEVDLDGGATMAGLAQPGEYLDVHFTPTGYDDDRYRGGFTMTMFKGVKVLALNRASRSTMSAGRSTNTVTLELTPEQANILLLAQQKGRLNLIYTPDGAGNGGVAVADEDKAFFEEILGLAPREEKKPFVTEHYYGNGRRTEAFNADGSRFSGGDGGGSTDGMLLPGHRPAPNTSGGHEPTGGWGSGYVRGIDNNATQNGNAAPAGNAGAPARLIPSPRGNLQGGGVQQNNGARTPQGI